MRITLNIATSGRQIQTDIGTLQFRKTTILGQPGWEVVNKTSGSITGTQQLEVLVKMMNDQIELEINNLKLFGHQRILNYIKKGGRW